MPAAPQQNGNVFTPDPGGYGPNPSYVENAQGQYDYNGNSGNPGEASPEFPTEQQAQQWWQNKYGSQQPGQSPLQPTYLSQMFPNGIPQTTTQTVGAPSTSGLTSAIMSALQPQFQQQDRGLTEALANAGIVGGSSAGAVANLGNQQQQQAMSQIAPYVLSGYQMQQGADEFNANAANTNNQFDISNLLKSGEYDSSLQASQGDFLAGLENQDWLSQMGMEGNLIDQQASGNAGSFNPIYTQPQQPNFGGIASAFAPQPNYGNGGGGGNYYDGYMQPVNLPSVDNGAYGGTF